MSERKPWLKMYDPGVPPSLSYPSWTLVDTLAAAVRDYPRRACTIFRDQAVSYERMDDLSTRLAWALIERGVKKGDRVGLLMPNIPQFILAFYAILKAGGVVVAMNPLYRPAELSHQIQDSGLRVLLAVEDARETLSRLSDPVDPQQIIFTAAADAVCLTDTVALTQAGLESRGADNLLTLLVKAQPRPLPQLDPQDAAIFQYSGGTTGIPKAAVGLHRNLTANTLQFSTWLSGLQRGREVVLAAIPLYHVYGMVIAMNMGVMLGASLVLIPNPRDFHEILGAISAYKATLFPGVPGMYQAINQHPDVQAGRYDLRSIKACISGSAPLRVEVKQTFEHLTGGKLLEGYGLSEAPTATHCNPMWGENRPGSIGLPLPDVECRIVDLEDPARELPVGEAGELLIRGPQIMAGYHAMPQETALTLRDGWLHTGDIARMDADGYFYLVGRKKEMIKIGGFQVWPAEVEAVLSRHPAVADVAVAGVSDPEEGEAVKAWVILKPGAALTLQEARDWCRQELAGYKLPAMLEVRGEFPRTTVGKLLRRELVRQHEENSAGAARSAVQ